MVQGRARTAAGQTWDFRWQALACDESSCLVAWLRAVAAATDRGCITPASGPRRAGFTEPLLAFEVDAYHDRVAMLRVELDLEFRAPSSRTGVRAGNPTVLQISLSPEELATAAAELETDVARYPDLLAGSA